MAVTGAQIARKIVIAEKHVEIVDMMPAKQFPVLHRQEPACEGRRMSVTVGAVSVPVLVKIDRRCISRTGRRHQYHHDQRQFHRRHCCCAAE